MKVILFQALKTGRSRNEDSLPAIGKIKQAVKFLEKRKSHAKEIDNKEWEKEFDNAITVIREMSGVDLKS